MIDTLLGINSFGTPHIYVHKLIQVELDVGVYY